MACPEQYYPSRTLLKSSLRSRSKEYPRVGALHGIAYVADSSRPKTERFFWFLCILASTIGALGIIFTLMERFETDPMMNSVELRSYDTPIELPRIYICPTWKSFNNILPRKTNEDILYEELYEWNFNQSPYNNRTYPDSLDDIASLRKFFIQNAPSYDQCIRNVTLTIEQTQRSYSPFKLEHTTAGICFTSSLSGDVSDYLTISFSFDVTTFPMRGYATLGEDTGLLRHLPLHYFSLPTSVTVELQETHTSPAAKILARSQRNCVFPGEQSPHVECVLNCTVMNSLKFCNCVPWYLAQDGIEECLVSKYQCLDSHSDQITDTSKCNCRQSCDNVVLKKTELEVLLTEQRCTINIKERSLLKYKRTVRFGWADLFISFGGIAGLFLGCSLLSIIEFGYYFSLRTYCGAVLSVPKRGLNVTKINVLDVTHPVNLRGGQKRPDLNKKRVEFYDYIN